MESKNLRVILLMVQKSGHHHLGCTKPLWICKWDKLLTSTGDRRISEPSTVSGLFFNLSAHFLAPRPSKRSFKNHSWAQSGQIITTSAEVTLNGGLVRESSQNPLNSGLGIILICPGSFSGFSTKENFVWHRPMTSQPTTNKALRAY